MSYAQPDSTPAQTDRLGELLYLSNKDMSDEPRYRGSHYFQMDRLRCSEASEDLRSMKKLMSALAEAFQQCKEQPKRFQPSLAPVPVNNQLS
jgi:hypothetical protein